MSKKTSILTAFLLVFGGFLILGNKDGAALMPLHELRDPYIFSEDGQDYLLYSVAGELGIAMAKLSLRWQ